MEFAKICRAYLLSGEVLKGPRKEPVRVECSETQDVRSVRAELMLCQVWPVSSCEIRIDHIYGPGELPVKNTVCRVLSVEVIKGCVYKVELQLPAGKLPEFYAGQYLALDLPGKESASYFSIASAPGGREITLHIQADPHLSSALEVINYCKESLDNNTSLPISLPYGKGLFAKFA